VGHRVRDRPRPCLNTRGGPGSGAVGPLDPDPHVTGSTTGTEGRGRGTPGERGQLVPTAKYSGGWTVIVEATRHIRTRRARAGKHCGRRRGRVTINDRRVARVDTRLGRAVAVARRGRERASRRVRSAATTWARAPPSAGLVLGSRSPSRGAAAGPRRHDPGETHRGAIASSTPGISSSVACCDQWKRESTVHRRDAVDARAQEREPTGTSESGIAVEGSTAPGSRGEPGARPTRPILSG